MTSIINFFNNPETIIGFIEELGVLGPIIFISLVVLQVVIAFLPGEPFEVAAGYIFGVIEGTIFCLIGIVIGTAIVYFLVKRFGRRVISVFFKEDQIKKLDNIKPSKLSYVVFLLSLIPGTPKDLLTYFYGLTNIKISNLLLIVLFARIPSVITSVLAGYHLSEMNYKVSIIVFVISVVLGLIGIVLYNKITEMHSK